MHEVQIHLKHNVTAESSYNILSLQTMLLLEIQIKSQHQVSHFIIQKWNPEETIMQDGIHSLITDKIKGHISFSNSRFIIWGFFSEQVTFTNKLNF